MVLTEAQVTRVILEKAGDSYRAVGVEFMQGGTHLAVGGVQRDVVICAGAPYNGVLFSHT